jgi:hypothetical protein
VKTVASKFAKAYGKRGFLIVIALVASLVSAKVGGDQNTWLGFFDGG